MSDIIKKSIKDTPDDKREFPNGNLGSATVGGVTFALATYEPGWKWSVHVKPKAGTEWCEVPHTLYEISGRMGIKTKDGQEIAIEPGDVAHIPPGHDGWVVGGEPAVAIMVNAEMADKFAK